MTCTPFPTKLDPPTLTVEGLSLAAVGRVDELWTNVLGEPELLGDPLEVPLRVGGIFQPRGVGTRTFGVNMTLHGGSTGEVNSHWRSLVRMLWKPRIPLRFERTWVFATGPETHYCTGQYVSGLPLETPPEYRERIGRVALQFLNLDGYWYSPTQTQTGIVAPGGTMTMPGDAPTRRVFIDFPGPGRLTNTSSNMWVQWYGSGPITLDVEQFTTSASVPGSTDPGIVDVEHHGSTHWMVMNPGDNTLVWNGAGTVTIRAEGAWL